MQRVILVHLYPILVDVDDTGCENWETDKEAKKLLAARILLQIGQQHGISKMENFNEGGDNV